MEHLKQQTHPNNSLCLAHHPDRAMQQLQQWVCWRYEMIGGQRKKPPYHPKTGRKTDIIQGGPWSSYPEAIAAYKSSHSDGSSHYDGIGFVFLPSDPYTGIDLDHCVDTETNEIAEWAHKILLAIPSRTEYSPSGDGFHIITKAKLPDRGLKEGNIEIYSHGVYFTWTNNLLTSTPEHIEEQQERVLLLHDWLLLKRSLKEIKDHTWGGKTTSPGSPPSITWQENESSLTEHERQAREKADTWILEKARSARNGSTFTQLYDTIIPDFDGGQSLGDLQLCVQLLYWCRDEHGKPDLNWADRLFRKSARMRTKWDRRLGKYTYGQVTLYKAYMGVERRYGQFWKGGK